MALRDFTGQADPHRQDICLKSYGATLRPSKQVNFFVRPSGSPVRHKPSACDTCFAPISSLNDCKTSWTGLTGFTRSFSHTRSPSRASGSLEAQRTQRRALEIKMATRIREGDKQSSSPFSLSASPLVSKRGFATRAPHLFQA